MANEEAEDISWPDTFSDLKVLESSLKCGICYEFMNTALITPCSHNFCSICIRKFMQYRTSCPECLRSVNEIELKNNRTLDEMIVVMQRLRRPLFQALKGVPISSPAPISFKVPAHSSPAKTHSSPKTKMQFLSSPQKTPSNTSSTTPIKNSAVPKIQSLLSPQKTMSSTSSTTPVKNSSAPKIQSLLSPQKPRSSTSSITPIKITSHPASSRTEPLKSPPASPIISQARPEIKVRSIANMMKSPLMSPTKFNATQENARKVVMVNCPICQVEIPESNINFHIDRCLERSNQEVVAAIKPVEKKPDLRRRLPKLVYELMKETELRRKCAELKLNSQGDKKTLIKRHKRYTLLYNSECDCVKPRPVSEIIKQLEKEERDEMKSNCKVLKALQVDRKSNPEVIQSAQVKYISENKSHFNKLEAELRERQKAKKAAKTTSELIELDEPSTSKSPPPPSTPPKDLSPVPSTSPVNIDSPGTPNSEMDLLLSQVEQVSPIIRKGKNVVEQALEASEEEDSLEAMFSQPIQSSSSAKKRKQKNKKVVKISSDSEEEDIWAPDSPKDRQKKQNSLSNNLPLRRSSRKRRKDSDN